MRNIAKRYRVSHEAIRLAEKDTVKYLKQLCHFADFVKPISSLISQILAKNGGIMSDDHLTSRLLENKAEDTNIKNHLFFLNHVAMEAVIEKRDGYRPCWRLESVSWAKVEATTATAEEIFRERAEPLPETELFQRFQAAVSYRNYADYYNSGEKPTSVLGSHLLTCFKFKQNPWQEWGLADWPSITPRNMGDKAYLIMQRQGKPLHVKEIADLIRQTGFDDRKFSAKTLHNFLANNKRFVCVGRSTYALKEWGYEPGSLKEVITGIVLVEMAKGRIPTREEIVKTVLEKRRVKEGSVLSALSQLGLLGLLLLTGY